jgi:hypothetical protein
MDTVTWQALTAVLTLAGLAGTVWFWRRRGAVAGLRMLAISLLPAAAYLTGTLRLLWEIGDAIVRWAGGLVFSPTVWLGVALAGTSVLLLLLTGAVRRRRGPEPARSLPERRSAPPAGPQPANKDKAGAAPPTGDSDDDMADIEAILKRHGIS